MANQEHLDILAKGVEAWNAWRNLEPEIGPDLSGADLNRRVYFRVDFRSANLEHSDLSRAAIVDSDLSNANLGKANLWRCVLNDSRVRATNLINADLHKADITGTDFTEANFAGARFERTRMVRADFRLAIFGANTFSNVDLSDAKNLDSTVHWAPSTIGIDSIYQSKGKIPEAFLRGAGVHEDFITYIKSVAGVALEYYSVFISYSTRDQDFAEHLHADLQAKGVRCWFAPHDIQGGRKVHEQIDEAIRVYDKLLLILSEASMNSTWVRTEIANARAREEHRKRQMLFPLSLVPYDRVRSWKLFDADTGTDSAREIREYFVPDFSAWKDRAVYAKAFERLLRDLKAGPDENAADRSR